VEPYIYVSCNPVNAIDPTGLFTACDMVAGIVGTLVGFGIGLATVETGPAARSHRLEPASASRSSSQPTFVISSTPETKETCMTTAESTAFGLGLGAFVGLFLSRRAPRIGRSTAWVLLGLCLVGVVIAVTLAGDRPLLTGGLWLGVGVVLAFATQALVGDTPREMPTDSRRARIRRALPSAVLWSTTWIALVLLTHLSNPELFIAFGLIGGMLLGAVLVLRGPARPEA
jgi:hypothetical protein